MLYTAGEKFVFTAGGMKNAFVNLLNINAKVTIVLKIYMVIAFGFARWVVTFIVLDATDFAALLEEEELNPPQHGGTTADDGTTGNK